MRRLLYKILYFYYKFGISIHKKMQKVIIQSTSADSSEPLTGEMIAKKTQLVLGRQAVVGKWSYIGEGSRVYSYKDDERVIIGKFCSIADNVKIFIGGEHGHRERVSTYPIRAMLINISPNPDPISKGPVIIGNDVWVGSHAIILSGCKISDGSVMGAGSVVSKNVPPFGIVAGNPARIIGYRFSQDIISKLLEIKWWDWDDKKIKINYNDFYGDICIFVEKHYSSTILMQKVT